MKELLNVDGSRYSMYCLEETVRQEVLRKLGRKLHKSGFVKESYIDAVCEREETFPTGLPMSMGIAIPHADTSHVNEEGMIVGVLKTPVDFRVMGSETEYIKVQLVFMLAIKEPQNQLDMLQRLIEGCQDEDTLVILRDSKDKDSIERILNGFIK